MNREGAELDARALLTPAREPRFWAKVDKTAGEGACWPWTAALAVNGYGVFGVARKVDGRWRNQQCKAHRVAWSLTNGPIPMRAVIRHECDNPPCCNPRHLRIGTADDNVQDKVDRERQARGSTHAAVMKRVHARGERSANARLTALEVVAMRRAFDEGESTASIAERFDVSPITAYRVTRRKSWRHVA